MATSVGFPFARPLYVLAKPVGARCNLRCDYCYYLEKSEILEGVSRNSLMDFDLLELFIDKYIEAQTTPEVLFTWHGGEPMLRPIRFYQRALELQKKHARGRIISNSIQTNGTLLNDEWCRFLKENNFLVGISIDGPERIHNTYRKMAGGAPTFQKVMRGIELLKKYEIEYNAMAVINNLNVQEPLEFYNFFKEIDCHYLQFTPIVERLSDGYLAHRYTGTSSELSSNSISAESWGSFLVSLFDEWVQNDVGNYFIQLFDCTLANWVGVQPGLCTLDKYCGHALALEHNGDLYSCDHFVFPEYRLGNIRNKTIIQMAHSPEQEAFGLDKYNTLPRQCHECEYLFACWGECPKNRFINDEYGEPGLNYLCKGYLQYFRHVAPYMDFMAEALKREEPPASIMNHLPLE
ncbi:MAG: anaerobic sulfatase-maturation protein [Porphyromonas sp.]|nr:anaerobic sulfatase-maturation protein [Porphyromonas sp.]